MRTQSCLPPLDSKADQHQAGPAPDPISALRLASANYDARRFEAALTAFVPVLENEVQRLVRRQISGEGQNIVFQPTALVNEAALLFGDLEPYEHRMELMGIAAGAVRRVLVEVARRRTSLNHEGIQASPSDEARVSITWSEDLIALDNALTALAEREPQPSRVVELRVFGGGLTIQDVGEILIVAPAVVKRAWARGRTQLSRELEPWIGLPLTVYLPRGRSADAEGS